MRKCTVEYFYCFSISKVDCNVQENKQDQESESEIDMFSKAAMKNVIIYR
jgi:hypothetical protein